MSKKRNEPTTGLYAAAADWAEHDLPDVTAGRITSGEESRAEAHRMLAEALGEDDGTDSVVENYARQLINKGGRPSLDPDTPPGVHAHNRQVRLPDPLDRALTDYAATHHTTRSQIIRLAISQFLSDQEARDQPA
jgi:hypothetical protein